MSFEMIYDKRNRGNLNLLADNTKSQAYKWYQYCIDNKIQILIYETIRTLKTQRENVKRGVSKTLRSYHLVGQALDFVFIDSKGNALWSMQSYLDKIKVVNYAKSLGFTWGSDWDNDGDWRDESFLDSPHLQLNYKGYGTDTFGKPVGAVQGANKALGSPDPTIRSIQSVVSSRYVLKVDDDGYYGQKTREALLIAVKKEMNENYEKKMGRKISKLDGSFGLTLSEMLSKVPIDSSENVPSKLIYLLQSALYVNGHKEVGSLDGKWGEKTIKAIKNFKRSKGFAENSLVGGKTWKELLG